MESNKTGITVILSTFILLFLVDLGVTLSAGEVYKYLEANSIYPYVGLWGIALVNIILVAGVFWLYKKSSNVNNRFYYINTLVTVCVVRVLVIFSNIRVALNPPTIEAAKQVTQAAKTAAVVKMWWLGFIPFLIGIISYWMFKMDHNIEIKKKQVKIKWKKNE